MTMSDISYVTVCYCFFTLLLNFCNKITCCAVVFTLLALTLNFIALFYGSKKAIIAILLCVSVSYIMLYNRSYYMYGKAINGLIMISLVSILVSSCMGLMLFSKLCFTCSGPVGHSISLLMYAIVDGCIMGIFLINKWPTHKVYFIFLKEMACKSMAIGVVYGVLLLVAYWRNLGYQKWTRSIGYTPRFMLK